ncbi:ATP-dependent sacrificial sulfur transferase LarE [Levilactobacillus brevis]|uniref:ATP-dependent sacrificial sulfur transferase LarE n=1 Tax=Levilactobacillus brevis TaxID=1580 RepID=UPI000B3FE40A|nr:ATP-dependent sacrificial sulfur transferase LarE [Levilactobacillus brevis]TYB00380.1 ATP-dependent sacrificial sulfur transferase LarE [Lactobacillus sp. SL9-6]MBT9677347.1 ATP-dependent sacrificial sulfur transferase LarE [Levilactobacillus brevis]MCP9615501.1 ATP-dependent sacrificial sulfur transferase LarE [Levilactobacillus brevis]MCT3566215.1 ATP-dependent sacrificial sulfur transferase LarE [Levilactobacillus brevis]QOX67791.1 ATP-dependent sacrificial sulfur transferase LarE [Levi
MMTLADKETTLQNTLKTYNRVVVGFSGGIDSTVVLKEALDVLGHDNVLAVVANSELFLDAEYEMAGQLAKDMGAQVTGIQLDYLANDQIKHNTPESWYAMKQMFYQAMTQVATQFNADAVLDGMIMDDNADFRPGLRARDEAGAVSVLQTADLYKREVRELAQSLGLTNWNKVASCSVSSRFPYNTDLTSEKLQRVMAAETYLRSLGFATVRVRVHDQIARIEVPVNQLSQLVAQNEKVSENLRQLGYDYITVDLQGFSSGRMNQTLSAAQKEKVLVG